MNSHKILTVIYILVLIISFLGVIITHVVGKMNDDKKMLDLSDNFKTFLQVWTVMRVILVVWSAAFKNK